jgi:hypothetical protein
MRQPCRDIARSPENAYEDGIADQDRDAEGDTEDPKQPASAGRGRRSRLLDRGIDAIGGFGQLEFLRGVASRLQAQRREC